MFVFVFFLLNCFCRYIYIRIRRVVVLEEGDIYYVLEFVVEGEIVVGGGWRKEYGFSRLENIFMGFFLVVFIT